MHDNLKKLAPFVALLLLGACGPIVQIGGNSSPPDALLTLRANSPAAPNGRIDPANTLLITQPAVPGALQTLRLPVLTSDTQIAYLVGATWVEQPARLFHRLLSDVVAGRAGVAVLDSRQFDLEAARKLSGQLQEFGLDVRDPANPQVRLRYDAILTGRDGRVIAMHRFEQTAPTSSQSPTDVTNALNAAANALAVQVADWIRGSR